MRLTTSFPFQIIFQSPLLFSPDAIEYDLTPICGSGLDVESRNDVSRSMARDSSSN